jgi:hypothetical protein
LFLKKKKRDRHFSGNQSVIAGVRIFDTMGPDCIPQLVVLLERDGSYLSPPSGTGLIIFLFNQVILSFFSLPESSASAASFLLCSGC